MEEKSILFIDDEEVLRKTISSELKNVGYQVTTAESGEEGIAKLEKEYFNVVLTDQVMGNVDGLEVLQSAKKLYPNTSVIILTGFGELSSAITALRLGADDYLLKPCDLDELKFRINNCLQKQEMQEKIKLYENILPICAGCKKIRDDEGLEPGTGKWLKPEDYIAQKTGVRLSHGMCRECYNAALKEMQSIAGD